MASSQREDSVSRASDPFFPQGASAHYCLGGRISGLIFALDLLNFEFDRSSVFAEWGINDVPPLINCRRPASSGLSQNSSSRYFPPAARVNRLLKSFDSDGTHKYSQSS